MLNMRSHIADSVAWLHAVSAQGQLVQLSSDSRSIERGDIFFAYPGDQGDGRDYIENAIERGAAAVVYETQNYAWQDNWALPHLAVTDLKMSAGYIAQEYYAQPDAAMFTVAVTGTNGKTSCAQWLGIALSALGDPSSVVGTLGVALFQNGVGTFSATGYTTPDAVLLQRKLAEMRDRGARALAIEASSIGLVEGRLNGTHVDVAVFTNLTRDHLDYHGDMAAYEAAKTILFDWPDLQHAVINLDDAMGVRLVRHVQNRVGARTGVLGYTIADSALDGIATLRASNLQSHHNGTSFYLESPFGNAQVKTQLIGDFNVSNVLAVLGVLLVKGVVFSSAIATVEALRAAPGRMQQLGGQDAPLVVIDYAHTPDALEKTLAALRPLAVRRGGKLWCLFGCGGDRDSGKRAQMGSVAEMADYVVVTSDNPRTEAPQQIIKQIMSGMKNAHLAIDDRATAILSAVKNADTNDVILLAGKGHETTQEINGRKLPFADVDHVALALAAYATMGLTGTMKRPG